MNDERAAEYVADAIEDVRPGEPANESERVKAAYLRGELSSDAAVLLSMLAGHVIGIRQLADDFNDFEPWRDEALAAEELFNKGWELVWKGTE